MHDERIHAIEQAIAQAEAQGLAWTNQSIYEQVGGRYGDLAACLKERRARTSAAAAVAVLEADPPSRTHKRERAIGPHLLYLTDSKAFNVSSTVLRFRE